MDSVDLWKLYVLVVLGVCCVGADEMSVMEGNSVILRTNVKTNQHEKIKWFFDDTRIAEISGTQSKICTDDQCKERFGNRLELDHQTGSLIITNIRTTDSGLYLLEIINTGSDLEKMFNVIVHGVSDGEKDAMKGTTLEGESDSGLSTAAVTGICVSVLLIVTTAAVGVIYYHRKCQAGQNGPEIRMQHRYQVTNTDEMTHNENVQIREKSV